MLHCENNSLSKNGQVNQGLHSIYTGFKGIPNEAEFMAIEEAIQIARYTGSEILIANVSTKEGVAYIANAKKNNLNIKASTASFYLLMDDQNILEYDTCFKTNPPLRSKEDVLALRNAVLDGTIDMVYSQHTARTEEEKNLEFDLASFGMINIQTYFLTLLSSFEAKDYSKIITACTDHPASMLEINLPTIDKGAKGKFMLFDMGDTTFFDKKENASKSINSPYLDQTISGKIKAIFTPSQTKLVP
jgi:dihydroorotase